MSMALPRGYVPKDYRLVVPLLLSQELGIGGKQNGGGNRHLIVVLQEWRQHGVLSACRNVPHRQPALPISDGQPPAVRGDSSGGEKFSIPHDAEPFLARGRIPQPYRPHGPFAAVAALRPDLFFRSA